VKQFGTILKFELKYYFKNKIFVGVTVFLMAVIAVVMFIPRIVDFTESFEEEPLPESGGEFSENNGDESDKLMLVSASDENQIQIICEAFGAAFGGYRVEAAENDIEVIKDRIVSGEAECAFVFETPIKYTYYVNNLSMYDNNTYIADEVLTDLYRFSLLAEKGISSEEAAAIMNVYAEHFTESLGKDQIQNFFYTYIMIFALYMVILLYGQMVATNVAVEKSSRAMELLITSAKPVSMMFGKVIASCIAGLIQLIAIFGSAYVFYNINSSYWGENQIITSIFDMPLELLLYMLIFFVLGFFIYAFLYGAIGSTASKVEDINTSVMPLTMLFIIAFMVVMFSMTEGNVDNTAMLICSYVPFTSPMAMFTRIAMSTVPVYEIVISVIVLIASVVGVGVLSAKIYRVGVLLYGTSPRIGAILKAVFRK